MIIGVEVQNVYIVSGVSEWHRRKVGPTAGPLQGPMMGPWDSVNILMLTYDVE